ncbi:DUF6421 family protein [Pedococcus sp. 5OH_020]|uniref:DUF6421 family protein n=1 Tax=Pedococcus sp. 5OH_020 TaxID=2989814 RepID=UPI0022EA0812|nr:DUF6421 family protein [Pedococcus sp. 5OH_020]
MRHDLFPHVLFDEAHSEAWTLDVERALALNPANAADASYGEAARVLARRGFTVAANHEPLEAAGLAQADVLVVAHPAAHGTERSSGQGSPRFTGEEIDAVAEFVRAGGGLVVLAECDQDIYGNNLTELLRRFGIGVVSTTVQDAAQRHNGVSTWVLADLPTGRDAHSALTAVSAVCFYRSGVLDVSAAPQATVLARTGPSAHPASAPLAVATEFGDGRVVAFADSDLFGDDSIHELDHRALWSNAVTWAAGHGRTASRGSKARTNSSQARDGDWLALKSAVTELRAMQVKDGSIDREAGHDLDRAAALVAELSQRIAALAPRFPHDAAYLTAVRGDLQKWVDGGFEVPDFLDSVVEFRPDLCREDGLEHLVVFPMYTQNGNPNRQFEAIWARVYWPQWLAEIEREYDNPMFLSLELVDFTEGYDTNSAVLFPETVAVREVPKFHWGAIFADREAARFRRITTAAADTLSLRLPPDAERLVHHQGLAQSAFALWDMIHDRTHSHGDLPFDPFMIKQRMPFWLYALEELRCDLNTFRQAVLLEEAGEPHARLVQYAIVFDRLFRFPITGDRVRNYDGLGGQLLFGYLHQNDVLRWTDNRLTLDWRRLPGAVVDLCESVEKLYRDGIDRSRVAHWLAAYELVTRYVSPHPASRWAQGATALPLDGPPKDLTNAVLPDEFPLNVFYESLRRKLEDVVASTAGITGEAL